jgi:hypothetical protein
MLHGIDSLDNWRQYFVISKLIRAVTMTFIAKMLCLNFGRDTSCHECPGICP